MITEPALRSEPEGESTASGMGVVASATPEGEGASDYSLRYDHPSPVEYPRLVPDLPEIGGRIRTFYEDFRVEEIPLYPFSGQGEHCYLTIEKRNRTTLQLRDYLARGLGISPEDIGFAGFKDRRAVTRQTLSIPREAVRGKLETLEAPWFRILAMTFHRNKIRTGHLAGNRFHITIREVEEGALSTAREILRQLEGGLPNYYGPQRFGPFVDGHKIGSALLHRDPQCAVDLILSPRPGGEEEYRRLYVEGKYGDALAQLPPGRTTEAALLHTLHRYPQNYRAAARRIPRQLKRMFFSAYQSYLFNWCLRERMSWFPDAFAVPESGDLAFIHGRGASFRVEDVEEARDRARQGEISPTGPIFGRKMTFPEGREGALEGKILEVEGLRPKSFLSHVKGLHLNGTRRPYRILCQDVSVSEEDDGTALALEFTLPPGCYATVLLDQIMGTGRATVPATKRWVEESSPVDEGDHPAADRVEDLEP